jgi:hypothetical protein
MESNEYAFCDFVYFICRYHDVTIVVFGTLVYKNHSDRG